MTDAEADEVEQYSEQSRERLRSTAAALATVLERHTAALIDEGGVGQALCALVHEHGEPWFEMPGLDHEERPVAPAGQILFSESWS